MADQEPRKPQGLGPPGPNPLFFGVTGAIGAGLLAAVTSSGTKTLIGSNLVSRLAVGLIVFGVAYAVVAALWFAWHRRTFKGVHGPGFGADAPDQIDAETNARDEKIAAFMETTTAAIDELNARVDALE
jgi:hypothetical protein